MAAPQVIGRSATVNDQTDIDAIMKPAEDDQCLTLMSTQAPQRILYGCKTCHNALSKYVKGSCELMRCHKRLQILLTPQKLKASCTFRAATLPGLAHWALIGSCHDFLGASDTRHRKFARPQSHLYWCLYADDALAIMLLQAHGSSRIVDPSDPICQVSARLSQPCSAG